MSPRPPPNHDMATGLFKLPPELRLEIYDIAFANSTGRPRMHPLLQTCHTIREEAMPRFYHHIVAVEGEKRAKLEAAEKRQLKAHQDFATHPNKTKFLPYSVRDLNEVREQCKKCARSVDALVGRIVRSGFPVQEWMKAKKKA